MYIKKKHTWICYSIYKQYEKKLTLKTPILKLYLKKITFKAFVN